FLGGSSSDLNWGGLHVDAAGTVYLAGSTDSVNFPVVDAIQPVKNSGRDVFVTVIAPDGAALSFSTFLGGNANEDGYGVAVDAAGSIYVTGETISTNFPVVNAWQPTKNTFSDAFVTKISL